MYNIEYRNVNGNWVHCYGPYFWLKSACKKACKQLAKKNSVNEWRVVEDDFHTVVYKFVKKKIS